MCSWTETQQDCSVFISGSELKWNGTTFSSAGLKKSNWIMNNCRSGGVFDISVIKLYSRRNRREPLCASLTRSEYCSGIASLGIHLLCLFTLFILHCYRMELNCLTKCYKTVALEPFLDGQLKSIWKMKFKQTKHK